MARSFKNIDNTGFSASSASEGARIMNADGSPNIRKAGLSYLQRLSIYHTLLQMPRTRFFLLIFGWYTLLNLFFAAIYFTIGVNHLSGYPDVCACYRLILRAVFAAESLPAFFRPHAHCPFPRRPRVDDPGCLL